MQLLQVDSFSTLDILVQIKVGSHLYGTSTSASDLDIKGVYLPSARDILLQRIRPVIASKNIKNAGRKNTSADVDYELYSLSRFLSLIAEGQTIALEMLFAPKSSMLLKPHPIWHEMKALSHKLFSKQTISFVRYCKKQAHKYGMKGHRIAAVRVILEYLKNAEKQYGSAAKLAVIESVLEDLATSHEFLTINEYIKPNGIKVRYFEICGKKSDLEASIKHCRLIAEGLINEYGKRALAAEQNAGLDWKALSHAVRVGRQAIEFITTHNLTFPRPEAQHLLEIRFGKLPFQAVSEEIEQIITDLEEAVLRSTLPESFDQNLIDNFIERVYKERVIRNESR